jgi:hypothetical protein
MRELCVHGILHFPVPESKIGKQKRSAMDAAARAQMQGDGFDAVETHSVLFEPSPSVSSSIICGQRETQAMWSAQDLVRDHSDGHKIESALTSS